MHRRREFFCVLAIAFVFVMFFAEAKAGDMDVTFHGYFESNFVLRDQNGIQNGFMDHANGVQQRNTLKFDVDIDPKLSGGAFSVSKVHLTYRGAYDSIYDLRANKYGDIKDNMGASRFDYGKKDVKFENDLREVFIDFCYNGALGSAFFRPGRQLVSWGEASGNTTILDVINPKDQSYQSFFQMPDDVKIPIYMARLNYSLPAMKALALNFDFLWVPDIRPTQFGPLDSVFGQPKVGLQAPFVSTIYKSLAGRNVRQKVPTEEQEYGAKVTADIGERLSVSAAYFRDVNNDAGFVFVPASGTIYMTHNVQHVYGAYFSYNIAPLDLVIRGEIGRHTGEPISRNGVGSVPGGLATFAYKPVTRWAMYADKKYLVPFITDHERTSFSFEWIHEKINEWKGALLEKPEAAKAASKVRDLDIFSLNIGWSWYEGRIAPSIFGAYNPGRSGAGGGSGMIRPSVSWQISSHFYTSLGLQAFVGDKKSRYTYAMMIPTSDLTLKLGYQW